MADYYPLLARAISSLPNSTRDSRDAIYQRARNALIGQLRSVEPPISEADINVERDALDLAVRRLEDEIARKSTASATATSLPASAAPSSAAPASSIAGRPASAAPAGTGFQSASPRQPFVPTPPRPTPSPGQPAGSPASPTPRFQSPPPFPTSRPAPSAPAASSGGTAAATPAAPPVFSTGVNRQPSPTPQTGNAPAASPAPAPKVAAPTMAVSSAPASGSNEADKSIFQKFGRSRLPDPAPAKGQDTTEPPTADEALETKSQSFEDVLDAEADQPTRTLNARNEGLRPLAPQLKQDSSGRLRHLIVGSVVAIVVVAVAVTAFILRDRPEDLARPKAAAVEADTSGKIADRVGGGVRSDAQAPVQQPRAADPASGGSQTGATTAQSAPANSTPGVAIAQRAALLLQAPTATDPKAVATYVGTVTWRVDSVPGAPGQPNTVAVRADVDIPDVKMKASLSMQRNLDESLPASHLIDLRFTILPGSTVAPIKQIDNIQMRREDSASGDPLLGVARPVRDNFFFIALAKGDTYVARNLELIRTRAWIDIPILLTDGKLAKITFEKGAPGDRAFNDAMATWRQ